MAVLVLLIPGIVFIGMSFMEFSRPEGWLDWLLEGFFAFIVWFSIPLMLALSLFMTIKNMSSDKSGELLLKLLCRNLS